MSSRPSYASSTYSDSTTYSIDAQKNSQSSSTSKRSFGSRVKSALSSIGEHPTARYERKNGLPSKPIYSPSFPGPSRI
ncbi:hypothetical protein JX265_007875 [Neoarthrinium moseri]|uniref:Uncharacterized protein n=1 Tax=Neoarthrinium moseri TaxID=1658444 RepID=A0A9Q0AMZ1_9PEZI|nr:uncharacterized protein JN550_003456 [Neoarthrinium moseri]KAI1844286.1 hypothetical protein JX266_009577 [Neoarthrinium moseri]KAI1866574.1 hypothetical protein JX265_007875 [Neoarthrinium moseri]KAI1873203.1 hypothetical protein JN550_003456 [Neoarthrinium moseri]